MKFGGPDLAGSGRSDKYSLCVWTACGRTYAVNPEFYENLQDILHKGSRVNVVNSVENMKTRVGFKASNDLQ